MAGFLDGPEELGIVAGLHVVPRDTDIYLTPRLHTKHKLVTL